MDASTEYIEKVEMLKRAIEKMGKQQHIEVLQLVKKYETVTVNENRNGVYINLSFIPDELVYDLEKYVEYIQEQEKNLNTLEEQKNELTGLIH